LESSYPYSSYYSTSNSQQCYDDKVDRVLSIDNYYIVKTEASMMDHVKSTGITNDMFEVIQYIIIFFEQVH
jgi:hypothetical protein